MHWCCALKCQHQGGIYIVSGDMCAIRGGKMHLRLSLEDLLLAGVPCTSSSFLSSSRTALSRGVGSSETERANASNLVDHRFRTSKSGEGIVEVSENNRKRKGKAAEIIGELKKSKVDSSLLTAFKDSWLLVGQLLLWNTTASSHPGTGSNSLDCLAFCDGPIAVCCTVQRLDVELIGQYVQVSSWTFVPAIKHSEKQCHAKSGSTGSDAVPQLKRTGCYEDPKLQDVLKNERVLPEALDSGGCLEIHSLRLLDQLSVSTAQVLDFPSLCLSPAAANAPNLVLESPLEKKGKCKPRLRVSGLLQCIGPPFLLPCKSSLHNASVATDGRFLRGQGARKSLFNRKSSSRVQSDNQNMLGYLVELRSCRHGTSWQPKKYLNAPSTWTTRYRQFLEEEVVDAGEDGTVAIYFSGSVASWRPLLGEMLGDLIGITGLRRKMIQLGPESKEICIYVATRTTQAFRIAPTVVESCTCKVGKPARTCMHDNGERLQKLPRDPFRHLGCLDGLCETARSSCLGPQLQGRIAPHGEVPYIAGQGLRSYVGKITSVLMQGQLLEVDNKVWLLLNQYKHTQVHGLRVGALVAVRHAHIMSLRSVSEKVLVLGACLRSHVGVVLHSISNAGSRVSQVSQSRLTKYIGSLPFVWAFWVLHVVATLKCKLQGTYSDAELLGSRKHAGLIRKVLPSMMVIPITLRRDSFKEFLLHEQFCRLGDDSASVLLSKVPPLSNFCKHVEMLWVDPVSSIWHEDDIREDCDGKIRSKVARFCKPLFSRSSSYVRNIISGVKLGIVLVGSLKVCHSTGKLQLVDATGGVDVVVPDLRSVSNLHYIYQVAEYKLVMEGEYNNSAESAGGKGNHVPSPLSWSSLLKGTVIRNRTPQSLSYYVKFFLRCAKRLEGLRCSSELQSHSPEGDVDLYGRRHVTNDPGHVWKGKEFRIALITHKYPARLKFSPGKEKQWTFDVEVVLLPYSLLIHQDNDARIGSMNPPLQNIDSSLSKVRGGIKIQDNVTAHQAHGLKGLGGRKTHAHDSVLDHSGCLIECSVRCLVEQSPRLKKSAFQPWCTLSASLFTRGCSARISNSGSYCTTKEIHWAYLSEAKLEKLVLSVDRRAVELSQLLNTGDWCLLPTLQDTSLAFNSSKLTSGFKRVEIDGKQPLISLQWRYAMDGQLLQADPENLLQAALSRRGSTCVPPMSSGRNMIELTECPAECEEDSLIVKMGKCSDQDTAEMSENSLSSQPQLVDAVLTLPKPLGYEFRRWLESIKRKLIPQVLNVSEAIRLSSHPSTSSIRGSNLGETSDLLNGAKLDASSRIFSLQGEVVSVQGKLEATECPEDPTSADEDVLKQSPSSRSSGRAQPKITLFQLRDPGTDQLIRVHINFDKYVRPIGFGPGAVVCFRRILLRRLAMRDANVLVGMSTTDVLVESVERRTRNFLHNGHSLPSQQQEGCAENVTIFDLLNTCISESKPSREYLKVHCRVVSVQGLELEWQKTWLPSVRNFSQDMLSVQEDVVRNIAVKWGCFIIDDGSAVAECWANGDQAANFLGFRGSAADISTLCPSIIALTQYSCFLGERKSASGASLLQVLGSLLRKHKRIRMQGEPPQGDVGTTSWLIKGVDGDLEESEAMVLRLFLKQASQLTSKAVHCTTMSENDRIFKYAEDYYLKQTSLPASATGNNRSWQNLTWNKTQLVATKVEVLNPLVELQQLANNFDL